MITLTRREIIAIYGQLNVYNQYKGIKFAYFITKLGETLKQEAEIINKFKYVEGFLERFAKPKNDLLQSYGLRNPDGSIVFKNKATQEVLLDPEKEVLYKNALSELETNNKDIIDAQREHEKEYFAFLEEEVSLEVPMVKMNSIPEEIKVEDFAYIAKFVEF